METYTAAVTLDRLDKQNLAYMGQRLLDRLNAVNVLLANNPADDEADDEGAALEWEIAALNKVLTAFDMPPVSIPINPKTGK